VAAWRFRGWTRETHEAHETHGVKCVALYDRIGRRYGAFRRPDPRIAAAIDAALGDVSRVVNVGAGAGSYEPRGRTVLAVEPSEVMIRQRRPGAAPGVQGAAEALPLATGAVEAAMAVLSVHHWTDLARGLGELARVARRRVVLLTWVPDAAPFWLTEDYFPAIAAHDRTIFPPTAALRALLERWIGRVHMEPVPLPHDCSDGVLGAYWRRPEHYLNAERRSVLSSFARLDAAAAEAGLATLRADLSSGRWAARNGALLGRETLDVGYRIVRCDVGAKPR
jgi:SAM-dependent methyltransferase